MKVSKCNHLTNLLFAKLKRAHAFAKASDYAASEYGDLDLRSDVMAVCEEKIRHGHTLSLACMTVVKTQEFAEDSTNE